jgi:ankyrin repeat protein
VAVMSLSMAALDGDVSEVRRLVAEGADVNEQTDGHSPVHLAAYYGHVEVVATLAELGADVDARDDCGLRPLHLAAWNGHVEVVARLVELGADVDAQGMRGYRPLHMAAHNGHVEEVVTLVELGADVDARDDRGHRPLHAAASNGQVEAAATLLQLGADAHAVAVNGDTPLHHASTAAIVTLLLDAGADLHCRDHLGITPLYSAIGLGHASAVTALVQAGAHPEASDGEWWTTLLVGAVTGDEVAMEDLIAASEELTRRMDENGHFARTAVQTAELCTHAQWQAVIAALTAVRFNLLGDKLHVRPLQR